MSLNKERQDARDRVQAVQESQGWDRDSMARLLLDYIEEHDDSGTVEHLAEWLTNKADEENREYAASQSG